jgi:hypothetical protein
VERNAEGRIRYNKPEPQPKDGPWWSREYTWLRDRLSAQALQAARWYGEFIRHRNRWLGYDEYKLPGCDLTVSERLGRKAFTELVNVPGQRQLEYYGPSLSSDGDDHNDCEALELPDPSRGHLTGKFEFPRPSAAEAAGDAMKSDPAAKLLQQRRHTQIEYDDCGAVVRRRIPEGERGNVLDKTGKPYKFGAREMMGRPENGPFPPRKPFQPPSSPPPTDNDERCPQCTGSCHLQSGSDPCAWRYRIREDDKALKLILQPDAKRLGDVTKKKALLDSFALEGQFPAPFEITPLEEILMRLHRVFATSQSKADWSRISDPQAKPLSVAERMALLAKQSPTAKPHEVILHLAKTGGLDLKYLAVSHRVVRLLRLARTCSRRAVRQQTNERKPRKGSKN